MKRLTAGFLLGLTALAALVEPTTFHKHVLLAHSWWILRLAMIVLACVLSYWNLRIYFARVVAPSHSRTIEQIDPVPESEAYALQKVAGKVLLNARQARLFALGLLEPAELRQRVVELYVPASRTLRQEVVIEAQIPGRLIRLKERPNSNASQVTREAPALFPLVLLPKGAFSDNLEAFNSDGGRVPTLAYKEYLQLTAGILRLFLCLAYGLPATDRSPHFPSPAAGSAATDVVHLEHRALCEIIKRAQANAPGVPAVSADAENVAKLLEELEVPDNGKVYLSLAAALVRKLSLHYALVAAMPFPDDGRLFLRYSRTLIPELELSPEREDTQVPMVTRIARRAKGWLRILLSARPVSVTVSLDNAWTCQSYHVRVDAPEGLYLARQKFVASLDYMQTVAKGAPTRLHYRFRRRLGQAYAHFYGRFFPVPPEGTKRPKLQLDFLEIPPGSDFRAAVASCACFGLVYLVGYIISRSPHPDTDVPAYLLVFPGIAASWLGFDAPEHRLFEGTLAARLSLVVTTATSLTASGAYVAERSNVPIFSGPLPASISLIGITQASWAVLVAIGFLNSLYMVHRWLRHSWRFKHLAERPDPDGD